MYQHQSHQGHNNLLASRMVFPPERQLFAKRGSAAGESGLVLSTDAKPRLKWNADLHEKFIDAVNQLGGADKATPKTIMRLMGIPGLTLYHLKSHLQKYRLGKNLQAQTNTGSTKNNVIGVTPAAERSPESSNPSLMTAAAPTTNKTMQINEALKMQIEVQRQLHEQLQVQKHLQLQIEAQGKYLQSVLEKAQETLGQQNLGSSTELEVAKVKFSDLVSEVSNEYLSNSFEGPEKNPGLQLLQLHPARPVDYSIDSRLASSEGSQKEQDEPDPGMGVTAYHENFSPCMEQFGEHARLGQTQKVWSGDFSEQKIFSLSNLRYSGRASFPSQRNLNIVLASGRHQREDKNCTIAPEVRKPERDEEGKFLGHPSGQRSALQENRKQSDGFKLPCPKTELELKIHQGNEGLSRCTELDLNGFSWN